MIAVIFEVESHADKKQYLDIAAGLKPILEEIDSKVLSLSLSGDREAILEWPM